MAGTGTFGDLVGADWSKVIDAFDRARVRAPASTNRIRRFPAVMLLLQMIEASRSFQEKLNNPGLQAALPILYMPGARHIARQNDLTSWWSENDGSLSDLAAGSVYGIEYDAEEIIPALSDVLTHAAGRPIDARDLTPDEARAIIESYEAALEDEVTPSAVSEVTEGNVSIVRRETDEIDCFEVPPRVDRAEFEQQLQEQENEINNTDIETLQRRRADFQNGDARRDQGAQRKARRRWVDRRARELRNNYGLDRETADYQARRESLLLDATHVLDMVAGGAADAISGLGSRRINRSIGAQWRGRRVGQLDALLERQRRQGRTRPQIELEVC